MWVSSLMGHFQNVSDTLSALISAIMLALLIAYCWPFIRQFCLLRAGTQKRWSKSSNLACWQVAFVLTENAGLYSDGRSWYNVRMFEAFEQKLYRISFSFPVCLRKLR